MDDGSGAGDHSAEGCKVSKRIKSDIEKAGQIAHPKKAAGTAQVNTSLGYVVDLREGQFYVKTVCVEKLIKYMHFMENEKWPSARELARLAGYIISLSLALGPIVGLQRRAIFGMIKKKGNIWYD